MNNSVYGKTMENLRKTIKIRVESNLAAIHEKKICVTLKQTHIYI